MALVHDGPFKLLAFLEVEGLSQRGGEVDVELLRVLALDALKFGRITHTGISSHKTRFNASKQYASCGGV